MLYRRKLIACFVLLSVLIHSVALSDTATSIPPGALSVITKAITYYICAKAAAGTCVYNGDGGTTATPSDSGACTTKAAPCATINGVATKLSGKLMATTVTIQLADTAGTGTDCYRPNNTIFNVAVLNAQTDSALEAGEGGANAYPSVYLYLIGNTTTPSSVIVTGATTCAGTTANDTAGVRFSNVNARVRGIKAQYFGTSTLPDSGAFIFSRSHVYAEDLYCTGDGALTQNGGYLLYAFDHSVIRLGSNIQWTVTNCAILDIANISHGSFGTPLGRANIAITSSGTWGAPAFFISNEGSHMGVDGASISVTGNSSAAQNVWYAIAHSYITWNDNSTFTAPAQTHTYNGANLTLVKAQQGSYINDLCRTAGQLTCNIGNVTGLAKRAVADGGSYVVYLTAGTSTTAETATNESFINGPNGTQFTWKNTTQANLGTPANGTMRYCSDCTIANPCAGGGTGAFAKRLNGVWVCN